MHFSVIFILFILIKMQKGHMATNMLKHTVNQLQLKKRSNFTPESLLKNTNRRRLYNIIT